LLRASAVALALEVGLHPSNIAGNSSVVLSRGAASMENLFAPYERHRRDRDRQDQGESNADDDGLAASHNSFSSRSVMPAVARFSSPQRAHDGAHVAASLRGSSPSVISRRQAGRVERSQLHARGS
jgi:hypothetical protein